MKNTDITKLGQEKLKQFNIQKENIVYEKKPIPQILKESGDIDTDTMSTEILTWMIKNVESYISNQTKVFKLDLILDNDSKSVEDLNEIKKLQDLYRAIPEDADEKETQKVRKKLDKITENVKNKIISNNILLKALFSRMVYYYEMKGFNKGKMLLQKLEGSVSILKFEYDAFSVGVKVRSVTDNLENSNKEYTTVKEYVIPEGFTLWIEIAFQTAAPPTNMF